MKHILEITLSGVEGVDWAGSNVGLRVSTRHSNTSTVAVSGFGSGSQVSVLPRPTCFGRGEITQQQMDEVYFNILQLLEWDVFQTEISEIMADAR